MSISAKYIIEWEEAKKPFYKITLANVRFDYTVFRYVAQLHKEFGLVMVNHERVDNSVVFDKTNYDKWETIQDALDSVIEETANG